MREHEQMFKDKGASIAAIGMGSKSYAQLFQEETDVTFPLLIDEGRMAYRAVGLKNGNLLHLLRPDNAEARRRARAAGHRQRGLGANPFQLGGSFVFGPGNVDLFAHISKTFGDNAKPEAILGALHS